MAGTRNYRRSESRPRRVYVSSDESNWSKSSGSSDSSDAGNSSGEGTSDDLDLGINGNSASQEKFRRLRRIFLNRPSKKKTEQQQQSRSSGGGSRAQLERSPSRGAAMKQLDTSGRREVSASSRRRSSKEDEESVGRSREAPRPTRPLQTAIDQHLHALCEQVKRHSALRDSTATQVQSILEQAVDELQFLKTQEERALESKVQHITESYALRLEVFQQQYLNKVTEIEDEMHAAIQQQQDQCDAAILATAKQLQEQTQLELLKDISMLQTSALPPSDEGQPLSSADSTASSSASRPKANQDSSRVRPHPRPRKALQSEQPNMQQAEVSPVSRQRAKLQALEEKLAAFSPGSVDRVRSELAAPGPRKTTTKAPIQQKLTPAAPSASSLMEAGGNNTTDAQDLEDWQASPLSPLRKGPSYWKKGISLEVRGVRDDGDTEASATVIGRRKRTPASLLSRRFLRPEEEEELRHLRASIGLAKDWMALNN